MKINISFFTTSVRLALSIILASVASQVVSAQPGGGYWSLGDRNEKIEARTSTGWKKVGSAFVPAMPFSEYWFPPAIASTSTKTGVIWSAGKTPKLLARLWDKNTGQWSSPADTSFYPPPLPNTNVMSAPALIQRSTDLLDLVVLGDQYYHAFYTNGKWSGWTPIGGMGQEPAITASRSGPTKLDVWVIAKGSVWRQRWEQSTGWQGWGEIGHPPGVDLTTAPGVTVRPDNTIDIVAPAKSDGQLWHAHFPPAGALSTWETIPGKTFRKPALLSSAADRLDVWVTGAAASDGRIYHQTWTPSSGWSAFDTWINQTPSGMYTLITSGVASDLSGGGLINIAAVNKFGDVLVRSRAAALPENPSALPTSVKIRRPMKSPPAFVIEGAAENTITIAPACNAVYLSLGNSGDLQKQKMTCVLDGANEKAEGVFKACDSVLSKNVTDMGSPDNQVTVLKNGTVLWLRQQGGVSTGTTRTGTGGRCRGIEHIYFASSCGTNWDGPVTLDPCDPKGPFDAGFCNVNDSTKPKSSEPKCDEVKERTGTDRPELLASQHDGSIFMAVGVAGTSKDNLVLLRSDESNLTSWKAMDTGLQSGGAVSLSESETHLYLARCEYGLPANVGLYAYRKDQPFVKQNLNFISNIANASCASGDVQISMMKNGAGYQVVRWVIPAVDGTRQYFKTGFSALTPGGVVTLQSVDVKSGKMMAMPTLVTGAYNNRALLYWYELSGNQWRVRGSVSDGIGKWSPGFNLSGAALWDTAKPGPWTQLPIAGHDYMKGYPLKVGTKTKFLAQWIQPVAGANEIFYGIVDW